MSESPYGTITLQTSVSDFFEKCYRIQNPRMMNGSPRSIDDIRDQIAIAERIFAQELARAGIAPRPLVMADLTDDFLAAAMNARLAEGKAPGTVNKLRRNLAALANFARRNKRLPLAEIFIPELKELKRTPRAWLQEELQKIVTAAGQEPGYVGPVPAGIWFSALILFCVNTGCRITSIMLTPRRCLDLDGGRVIVPAENQKHGADEPFPLTPECLALLKAIDNRILPMEPDDPIFGDWPFDRRQTTRRAWPVLNRRLKKIIVRAGLRATTEDAGRIDMWHKFRKTMASYVAARLGPEAAQRLLGHSGPGVTKRYLDDRIVKRPDVREALPTMSPAPHLRIVG